MDISPSTLTGPLAQFLQSKDSVTYGLLVTDHKGMVISYRTGYGDRTSLLALIDAYEASGSIDYQHYIVEQRNTTTHTIFPR